MFGRSLAGHRCGQRGLSQRNSSPWSVGEVAARTSVTELPPSIRIADYFTTLCWVAEFAAYVAATLTYVDAI